MQYTHGRWTIDTERRELRDGATAAPVGGRAFEILEVLVRAAGEVVTKTELIERVWPGAVVSDNALEVHISSLRKAFGSDRGVLKTVSGRGYTLTGEWKADAQPRVSGQGAAPAMRAATFPARQSNLPLSISELVGREAEIQFLRDRLMRCRTITLTGAGGIGKTRLGLEVARSLLDAFDNDVQCVELASLSDARLVCSTVAGVLGLKLESSDSSPQAVARAIANRRVLLLLDNCEHLIEVAAQLTEAIMRSCAAAFVLVTSRELLKIEGEETYRVPPLAVPDEGTSPEEMQHHSAVQLFVARMRSHSSDVARLDLATVASICRQLDGIPLAIEFAAGRAATLDLHSVLVRLSSRFDLLTGGRRTALPQHQTLRATLDWSYEMLSPSEKILFRALGIFRAGFTIDAAVAVAGGARSPSAVMEGIANLAEKSLLAVDGGTGTNRWRYLETTRAYAFDKLSEAGEAEAAARRHAQFFRELIVPISVTRLRSEDVARFGREIDNVRAVLDWAFGPHGDPATGILLTAAYVPVWFNLMLMVECTERVERTLEMLTPELSISLSLRAQLHVTLGFALLNSDGLARKTGEVLAQGLELAESLDDAALQLRALWGIWSLHFNVGRYEEAKAAAERVLLLAQRTDDPVNRLVGHRILGSALHFLGQQSAARSHLAKMLDAPRPEHRAAHPMWFLLEERVLAKAMQARVLLLQGLIEQARSLAQSSLEEAKAAGDKLSICYALRNALCPLAIATRDLAAAEESVAMLIDVVGDYGTAFWLSWAKCLQGQLLVLRGELVDGVTLLRAGIDTRVRAGWLMRNPEFLGSLAVGLAGQGRLAEAFAAVDEALAQSARDAQRWCAPDLLRIHGELLWQAGDEESLAAAGARLAEAAEEARRQQALFFELRAATSRGRLLVRQGRQRQARQELAQVYDQFTEGFSAPDLRDAKALIGSLGGN